MLFCVVVDVLELQGSVPGNIHTGNLVVFEVLLLAAQQRFQELHRAEALVWKENLAWVRQIRGEWVGGIGLTYL